MGKTEPLTVPFPTLGLLGAAWTEVHCVIPDGFRAGSPFILTDEQLSFYANHYRVRDGITQTDPPLAGQAFTYRRSQLVRPQKWGKSPLTAAMVGLEGVGPALFAGWAGDSDAYVCADHGCRCGWVWEYELGEPMGMPWPTPLIQITATSDDQTDNVYDALRPMIDQGPLHELIPKTGEEFIRLPGGGRIDTVTSNARSRLGQRVTFVVQDETGIWTARTGMIKVAETQRRGLAGMDGRAVEITNAWDPAEHSVAQRTSESKSKDLYRDHRLAPARLSYRKKAERRRIHVHVYGDSWWVNLDSIEAEAAELLEVDPAQAERFFGNRSRAAQDAAFDPARWKALASPTLVIADKELVVAGVDGARFDDALAIIATHVETGHQWDVDIIERPLDADDDYEHDADRADGAMADLFDRFDMWRVYVDPQWIDHLFDRWQGRYGDKKILPWYTNRPKPIAYAVRNYLEAQIAGDLTHDGSTVFAQHIANARRRSLNIRDDKGRPMFTLGKETANSPLKIDGAMAGVISWECRGDAIAANAKKRKKARAAGF